MINFAEAPGEDPVIPERMMELTEQVFAKDGWLHTHLGLEHRPQQEAMAFSVAASLANDESLLFEAGTGVGKSLAYLVPGIIHSVLQKRPFLVSSHTIALQQQIEKKDLALCRYLFSEIPGLHPFKNFKYSLLVGRGNYLCGHRLLRAMERKADLFENAEIEELERIAEWRLQTETGMREELRPAISPGVWDWVNADSSSCNRKNCNPDTCFFRKALAQRADANVIIINHSLLFSLMAAGLAPQGDAKGILYADDFLVIDEAHTVPDTATEHFGISVSSYAVDRVLKRLYTTRKSKPRGLLARIGERTDTASVLKAQAASESFFNAIAAGQLRKRTIARLRKPNWIDASVARPLGDVINRLRILAEDNEHIKLKDELRDQADLLQRYSVGINACIELKDAEDTVYWVEKRGRTGKITTLRSAPLEIGPTLRGMLFERGTSAVLTSATLASAGQMEPFQERCGAHGVAYGVEASPFDYENNLEILIATDVPQPTREGGRLDIDYLAEIILHAALAEPGGTLALFTSYSDLTAVARLLEEPLGKARRPLLAQGGSLSRSEMKADFVEAGNAVLLGTDSFWTGFDVPGPALSQLIITRLPFENPEDPIREARRERILACGGQPFMELTLPEAVIRFRQGVGRLIRQQSDTGKLILLDSRVLNKPYGRTFLDSLPKSEFIKLNRNNKHTVIPSGSLD